MKAKEFCDRYQVERLGTNSLKWDALDIRFGNKDLLSMWVADMEFKVPEQVQQALITRIEHGVFGYSFIGDEYYNSVINWQFKRHGNKLEKEWFRFSTGVVEAIYLLINAYTNPGDSVMIITPVYYPFHNAVKDTGRNLVRHKLINKNGHYSLDFTKFEQDIASQNVKMLIACSPHNPVGRVWTEQELQSILEICRKHNVLVISDEIHQDIIIGDKKQIPMFAVDKGNFLNEIITVTAASKTFNLAGFIHSHIFIPDAELREKYDNYAKTVNQTEVNIMGCVATQSAYTYGEDWLEGLLDTVRENHKYVLAEFSKHAPGIIVSPLEGTYLLWVDIRAYLGTEGIKEFIQDKCNLAIDFGEWFCPEAKGFIRINLATNPEFVKLATANIIRNIQMLA